MSSVETLTSDLQPKRTAHSFIPELVPDYYDIRFTDKAAELGEKWSTDAEPIAEIIDWGARLLGQEEMLAYLAESPYTMAELTAALALAKTPEQREAWQQKFGAYTERIPRIETRFEQLARLKESHDRLRQTYPEPGYDLRLVTLPYKDVYSRFMPAFNAGDTTPSRLDRPTNELAKLYGGEVHVDPELLRALRGKITPNITGIRFGNTPIGKLAYKSSQLDNYGLMLIGKELRDRDELRDMRKITGVDCMSAGLAEGLAIARYGGLRIGDVAGFPQYIPNSQADYYCGVNVERLFANNPDQHNPRLYFGLWQTEGAQNCLLSVTA